MIDRTECRRMLAGGTAQLVEVLPRAEYEAKHIQGAINIPLKELTPAAARALDRDRPVIVYCNDYT